jgi:hypothetical protein
MLRRVNRGRFVRKGVEAGSEGATPTRALLPLSAWRQGAVYAQVASTNVSPIVEASHFSLSGWRVPTLKNAGELGRFRSSTLFAPRCTRPGVATERRRSFILARSASCAELAYCSASAGSLSPSTPTEPQMHTSAGWWRSTVCAVLRHESHAQVSVRGRVHAGSRQGRSSAGGTSWRDAVAKVAESVGKNSRASFCP